MLYCVSYSNGAVGIFSSLDKVKELVFDKYPSLTFITQIFKQSNNIQRVENKHIAWVVLYKESETYAYVSDNKEEAINALSVLDKIGKAYEESIDYFELEIDIIPESTKIILNSFQKVYEENGIVIDSTSNIISYI